MGLFLRSLHILNIGVDYRYIVRGHSHIALLGWVYLALITLFHKLFLNEKKNHKRYRQIFVFTQITLVGMLCTFPFQGYAFLSITFSTLFLFASYWYVCFFIKNTPKNLKDSNWYKYILIALFYNVISTLGPWALGIVMATLGKASVWYKISIYFYLHFQYNGWMLVALLGILIAILEKKGIHLSRNQNKYLFYSVNFGVIFTFFLPILWAAPIKVLYLLNGLGVVLQLFAFLLLLRWFSKNKILLKGSFSNLQVLIGKTVLVILGLKIILQFITSIPYFANLAFSIIEFTIGYLHLTFLGVISMSLFLFFDYFRLLSTSFTVYFLFLIGFIVTETLIFYKGSAIWLDKATFDNYYLTLTCASAILVLAIGLLLKQNLKIKTFKIKKINN